MKYETTGYDKEGRVTHAGTYEVPKWDEKNPITQAEAQKVQDDWERHRKATVRRYPGDSPLTRDAYDPARQTVKITFEPAGPGRNLPNKKTYRVHGRTLTKPQPRKPRLTR